MARRLRAYRLAFGFGKDGAVASAEPWPLTRLMKTLLFKVSTTDPAAFAGVAALFLLAALAASYFPARRATQIDPVAAPRV